MERMDTQSHNDFLNSSIGHTDTHTAPALRESIGSLQHGDIPEETSQRNERLHDRLNDNRMVGVLESIGIPRSTTENVMRAMNSPQIRNSGRKVTSFVRRHPAQVIGALSAVTAGIVGWSVYSSRKRPNVL